MSQIILEKVNFIQHETFNSMLHKYIDFEGVSWKTTLCSHVRSNYIRTMRSILYLSVKQLNNGSSQSFFQIQLNHLKVSLMNFLLSSPVTWLKNRLFSKYMWTSVHFVSKNQCRIIVRKLFWTISYDYVWS